MSSLRLRGVCLLASLTAGTACLAGAAGVEARPFAPPTGTLAFETDAGLFVVGAGGGAPQQIPGTTAGDGDPAWSPNGTQLVFDREQDGNGVLNDGEPEDLYLINADGSGLRRLTHALADDAWARWSPDGRSVAFQSERDGVSSVYVLNVRTGAARLVARKGWYPDWTTDGRILFVDLRNRISVVGPYGADRQELPMSPSNVVAATPSGDGRTIVYVSRVSNLYLARSDGSRQVLLVGGGEANDPAWSPDDEWLSYDFGTTTSSDIYLIRLDGTMKAQFTHVGDACCADWRAGAP